MDHELSLTALNPTSALWAALASTAALAVLHLLAPRIRKFPMVPEKVTASFAGGIAVSYVFLHLIPEVAKGNERLRALFGEEEPPTPLVELGIFTVALFGLILFYGLERLAARERGPDRSEPVGVFWLHLGSFGLYNAVITYTLPSAYATGTAFAILFTIAMGLHFVLSDRGLEEHYPVRFGRALPRVVLAGALLLGWVVAWLAAPTSALTVSLLIAFLAGGVLLNVFKDELPSARRSSFGWFVAGAVVYAALMAAVTLLGAEHEEARAQACGDGNGLRRNL